jgi:hypothetical protein
MVVLRVHNLTDVVAGLPLGLAVSVSLALGLDAGAARWQRTEGSGLRRRDGYGPEPARRVTEIGPQPN